MKKFVLAAALLLVYVPVFVCTSVIVAWAQEQKVEQPCSDSAAVYEYKGLKRSSDQLWMVFEVFTADPKKHEEVWVPPWALRVEVKEPKPSEEGAWLTWRLEKGSSYAAEAWLRVSSANVKEAWDKYLVVLEKELSFRYQLSADELTTEFKDGMGVLVVVRPKRYGLVVWGKTVIRGKLASVSAPLDRTNVVIDKEIRGVEVVVDWGLALLKSEMGVVRDHSSSISAPKLEIRVQNGTAAEYWETKFLEWRNKLEPHIILPPEEKK